MGVHVGNRRKDRRIADVDPVVAEQRPVVVDHSPHRTAARGVHVIADRAANPLLDHVVAAQLGGGRAEFVDVGCLDDLGERRCAEQVQRRAHPDDQLRHVAGMFEQGEVDDRRGRRVTIQTDGSRPAARPHQRRHQQSEPRGGRPQVVHGQELQRVAPQQRSDHQRTRLGHGAGSQREREWGRRVVLEPLPDPLGVDRGSQQDGRRVDRTCAEHHAVGCNRRSVDESHTADPPMIELQPLHGRRRPNDEVGPHECGPQ